MKKIVILISGKGSLLESFAKNENLKIVSVIASKECIGIQEAEKLGLDCSIETVYNENLAKKFNLSGIEILVLAGFLKVLPTEFIETFEGKIVNCHPSLLPKFGGKGFYGDKVHLAVLSQKETESGITIHFVDSGVDEGEIIKQFQVKVTEQDNLESLKAKIYELETAHYNQVVETL